MITPCWLYVTQVERIVRPSQVASRRQRVTGSPRHVLAPPPPFVTVLLEVVVPEDVAAGRLRSDLDADAAVSVIVGAYLGELVRRGKVDDDFADKCIHLIWIAMTAEQPE